MFSDAAAIVAGGQVARDRCCRASVNVPSLLRMPPPYADVVLPCDRLPLTVDSAAVSDDPPPSWSGPLALPAIDAIDDRQRAAVVDAAAAAVA